MPERQKPIVPRPEELWLERKSEDVTLLGKDTMTENLREVFDLKTLAETERDFFPLLVRHAGETVPVSRVPGLILDAVREHTTAKDLNLRHFASEHVPRIIDAMLAREDDRRRAREFLASAING